MQVILLERMEKLGHIGDVVNVKLGYARNFLLPQKKALRATKSNLAVFEEQKKELEAVNKKKQSEAEVFAKSIDGKTFSLVRQASANDQLYGSVTVRDIEALLIDNKVDIARQHIRLNKPIKTIGMHPLKLTPHPEVSVQIYINVAKSSEEATAQMALLIPKEDEVKVSEEGKAEDNTVVDKASVSEQSTEEKN